MTENQETEIGKRMTACVDIEVPFHDVDIMGIVWHGHYVKYLELARCELLDQIGFGYMAMAASAYSWPVIDLRTKYVQPARFGQALEVEARLREWDLRLKIDYLVRDKNTQQRICRGSTAQVAVDRSSGEMIMPLPQAVQDIFQAYSDAQN